MQSSKSYSQSLLFLAAAFALPPKIVSLDWSLSKRKEMRVPEKRAKAVELLSKTYQDPAIDVLDNPKAETSRSSRSRLKSSKASESVEGRFEFKEGVFQVNSNQLAFISRENKNINLWSIPIGFEALKWERAGARTGLVAWDIYPSQIFFLDWGDRATGAKALGYKIQWSEDSEIIRFFECHFGHWILVENLPNGMTRSYFIEREGEGKLILTGYTVFDLNPKASASEVYRVTNEGCQTLYFDGSFGRVRVRY